MKIFNAHCHIYPDLIAGRAIEGIKDFYKLEEGGYLDGTVSGLLKDGEKFGIEKFLVHSVATVPRQVTAINDFIASAVTEHPDKFIGFGSLHPDSENMDGDLKHLVDLGLKGVKLHPDFQFFYLDEEKGLDMFRKIAAYNLPVMVHCGDTRYDYSSPEHLKNMLLEIPELRVIGAHLGGWSRWEEAVAILPGIPNLWVDCSSSFSWLSPEKSVAYIRAFGADRVMFGTDYPMWKTEVEMENISKMDLTESELEQIMYKTAADFLGV